MTILGLMLAMCMQVTNNPPASCNWNGIIAAGGTTGKPVSCVGQLTKDEKKMCDKEQAHPTKCECMKCSQIHSCGINPDNQESQEPMDAPAVQTDFRLGWACTEDERCIDGLIPHWSCSDKRRVLLTDESGRRHCILFGN